VQRDPLVVISGTHKVGSGQLRSRRLDGVDGLGGGALLSHGRAQHGKA
jgi:hypothetical protein